MIAYYIVHTGHELQKTAKKARISLTSIVGDTVTPTKAAACSFTKLNE